MDILRSRPDGSVLLTVHVQPRASRDELAGLHDNALKLRLTSPPVDGKANKAALAFLASCLGLPKSALSLHSGARNRRKQVLIQGLSLDEVRSRLLG